jgi:hypothetical protein
VLYLAYSLQRVYGKSSIKASKTYQANPFRIQKAFASPKIAKTLFNKGEKGFPKYRA